MNSIVIFYSRSGNTKFVAEEIATILGSDIRPLIDRKERKGMWGYFWSGFDSIVQNKTQLELFQLDLSHYDVIFLGCPNWAFNLPPAMRTFLMREDWQNKKVVLFCTQESSGAERVFNNLRLLCQGAEVVSQKFFNKVNKQKEAVREQVKAWLAETQL